MDNSLKTIEKFLELMALAYIGNPRLPSEVDKKILENNKQYHQHIYEKTYDALMIINEDELYKYDQCIEIFFENDEQKFYRDTIAQKEDFLRTLKDEANKVAIEMTNTFQYQIQ